MTEGAGGLSAGGWGTGDVRVTSAKPLTNGRYTNGGVGGGGVNVTLVLSSSVTCSEVVFSSCSVVGYYSCSSIVFTGCTEVGFSSCSPVVFSSSCSMVSPFGSGDLLLFLDVEINEGLKVVPRVSSTCSDTVDARPSIADTSQPPFSFNSVISR